MKRYEMMIGQGDCEMDTFDDGQYVMFEDAQKEIHFRDSAIANHVCRIGQLEKDNRALTEEVKRLQLLTQWRPVESALRDGAYILATNGSWVSEVKYVTAKALGDFEGWLLANIEPDDYSISLTLTHWMPLPEPPK